MNEEQLAEKRRKLREYAKKRYHALSTEEKLKYNRDREKRRKGKPRYRKKYSRRGRKAALKIQCVEYKGGKCFRCGIIDSPCIYDFHHQDPKEKEFTISTCKNATLTERIKVELDKCDLLCANCHRKTHNEIRISQ